MAGAYGGEREDRDGAYGRGAYAERSGGWTPRYRRARRRPAASHVYQYEGSPLVAAAVAGTVFVVAGAVALVVGLVVGEIVAVMWGLFALALGAWAVFFSVWTPHRVVLDDAGVALQAVARRVHIPWDDLESVGPPWWDTRHQRLRWRRRRGSGVTTLQACPDQHRMLVEIERRSAGTSVWS